jgi:sec-independent protein translocase protein TatA
MGKFGTMEIILIVVVILLLFGGKKIPELMRGLGRGMREFKESQKGDTPDQKP